jgi:mevalonate kinase
LASGRAIAKVILLGEHAVVYGRPALAVPVSRLEAEASVRWGMQGSGILITAKDLGLRHRLGEPTPEALTHLETALLGALEHLEIEADQDLEVEVRSHIPMGRGLGSGAAVATALVRAVGHHFGLDISASEVSALVFETEKVLHGTPSGIDNAVVALECPLLFQDGRVEALTVGCPFTLAIADTGVTASTRETVGDVRLAWDADPERYEALFDGIGEIVRSGRGALEEGDVESLGSTMDENQELLEEMEVSSQELESLIDVARAAGALGAKLSGGGRGGNIIALAPPEAERHIEEELQKAGATRVLMTRVS